MQNIWKKNTKLMLILLLDVFIISGATYAATTMYQSNTVEYDNTTSGLNSNNVQDALDEVYSAATDYIAYETRLSALESSVSTIENNYLSNVYPVGSIYIGVNNTNPGTLFGGTWVSFGTGRTLVGVDTSQTEFDTVQETGGSKTHQHIYGIKYAELYSAVSFYGATGVLQNGNGAGAGWSSAGTITAYFNGGTTGTTKSGSVTAYKSTANTSATSSLQPYITVYMWKRTA